MGNINHEMVLKELESRVENVKMLRKSTEEFLTGFNISYNQAVKTKELMDEQTAVSSFKDFSSYYFYAVELKPTLEEKIKIYGDMKKIIKKLLSKYDELKDNSQREVDLYKNHFIK